MQLLINNAGISTGTALVTGDEAAIRREMDTNFFGPLLTTRAFAPILAAHSGSALVDLHSVASWAAFGGAYSASKAALWSATNSLRLELAPRGVHVTGVHMGYVDTAMAAHADGPKLSPEELVRSVFDAVEADRFEVVADDLTAGVKAGLSGPIEAMYPQLRSSEA